MKPALKIAGMYLAVSLIWIYFSDRALLLFFHPDSQQEHNQLQTIKGTGFVLFTAVLLYLLVKRYYQQLNDKIDELEKANKQLDKQAQALKRSNEELEQFAFIASHDLQEPLRMVSSFLTRLESRYGDKLDDKGKSYLHYAVDGARRMRQLLLDLLDYSRIGKRATRPEKIQLNELVDEVCRYYQQTIQESGAQIETAPLPEIVHYRSLLLQVFSNLISNALKFHQPGHPPRIRISAAARDRGWEISVEDRGIGIDPAYQQKVFELFRRLHTASEYPGTGIGLSIVRKIIDHIGEKIWLRSGPGEGSVFTFTVSDKVVGAKEQVF